MFLYAWYPKGNGPWSFFVTAMNQEAAYKAVKEYRKKGRKTDSYFLANWPVDYDLEVFTPGEVAINNND